MRLFALSFSLLLPLSAVAEIPIHQMQAPTLERPVEIVYDSWGVPHLRAETERDVWLSMGFAHARDRFFQMDITRRTIRGTKAELLGEGSVASDHDMRLLGIDWGTGLMWDGLEAKDRAVLEAYTEGVNAWRKALISGHPGLRLPPEYEDLGLEARDIVPWEARDSMRSLGGFIFVLTQAIGIDLLKTAASLAIPADIREDVLRLAPADTVPALYPGEYQEHLRPRGGALGPRNSEASATPKVERGDLFNGLQEAVDKALALWTRVIEENPWFESGGSNAWTVAGHRSESGFALFASDNHVGTPLPPIYHEMHLSAPEAALDVYGVTIPGGPVVANGFNRNAAWAYTVLPVDGSDLFWEKLLLPNRVIFMGELVDVEVRHETYFALVDGELVDRSDLIEEPTTFYVPHHGPILAKALFGRRALSYRWVGFEKATFVEPLLRRMRATNADEALEASRDIDVFGANMVVADVYGDIGYTVTGTFPIRRFKDMLQPYWPRMGGGLWEWRGRLDRGDYLSSISPPRGFIATSNNDPAGYAFDNRLTNDPVYYAYGHDLGFRQRRIHEELIARTPLTIGDMMETQNDVRVEAAERLLPHLFEAAAARSDLVDAEAAEALEALESWDTRALVSSHEQSIFHEWWFAAAHALLDDDIGEGFFFDFTALSGLLHLLDNPDEARTGERLWDDAETTDRVETKEEILIEALDSSLDALALRFGTPEIGEWEWGEIHTKRLSHPLGGEYDYPPRSRAARPIDSGDHTVSPMESGFRLVAEMDPAGIRAWMVLPGGNSGLPGSDHYADQAEMYFEGEYRPVLFEEASIDADAEEIWQLVPQEIARDQTPRDG